jgi:hypothetical protein
MAIGILPAIMFFLNSRLGDCLLRLFAYYCQPKISNLFRKERINGLQFKLVRDNGKRAGQLPELAASLSNKRYANQLC